MENLELFTKLDDWAAESEKRLKELVAVRVARDQVMRFVRSNVD